MGQPAAKFGDRILATDTHIVLVNTLTGTVPTPLPSPFNGTLNQNLSQNVFIMGQPAACVGSVAVNQPPHIPQGGPFQRQPSNRGEILSGSQTVFINGRPAARHGDPAKTCNDPVDLPSGRVTAAGKVLIG